MFLQKSRLFLSDTLNILKRARLSVKSSLLRSVLDKTRASKEYVSIGIAILSSKLTVTFMSKRCPSFEYKLLNAA